MLYYDTFSPNAAARTNAYLVGSSFVTHNANTLYTEVNTGSTTGANHTTSNANNISAITSTQSTAGTVMDALGSTVELSTSGTHVYSSNGGGNGATSQTLISTTTSIPTSSTYLFVNTRNDTGYWHSTSSFSSTSTRSANTGETSSQSSSMSQSAFTASFSSGATTNNTSGGGSNSTQYGSSFSTSNSASTLVEFTGTAPHPEGVDTTHTVATAFATVNSDTTNEFVISAHSTTSTQSILVPLDGGSFTSSETTVTYTETTYSSVETTTKTLGTDEAYATLAFRSTDNVSGTTTNAAFTDGNGHSTIYLQGNPYSDGRRAWVYSHLLDGITVARTDVPSLTQEGKFAALFSEVTAEEFTVAGQRIYAEESYTVPVYTRGFSNNGSNGLYTLTNGSNMSSASSISSTYSVTVNLGDVDSYEEFGDTYFSYAVTYSRYNTDSTWSWETYSTSEAFAGTSMSEVVVPFYYQSVSTTLVYASLSPEYSCPITYWSKETCDSTTTAETTTSTDISSTTTTEGTRTLGICTSTLPVRVLVNMETTVETYIAGYGLYSYDYTLGTNTTGTGNGWSQYLTVGHSESVAFTSVDRIPLFPALNSYGLHNSIYGQHNSPWLIRAVVPWLPNGWAGFYRTMVSNYDDLVVGRSLGATLISGSDLGTSFDTKNFTYAGATASLVQGRKVSVVHLEPKSVYAMESGGSFAGVFNSTYFSGTSTTVRVTFTATTEKTHRLDGSTYEGGTTALATYLVGLAETISGNFFLPVEEDVGGDPDAYYVRDFKPYYSTGDAMTVTMGGVHGVTKDATYYAAMGYVTYETYGKGESSAIGSGEVSNIENTVSFALPASVAVRLQMEPHYTVSYGGVSPLVLDDTLYPS